MRLIHLQQPLRAVGAAGSCFRSALTLSQHRSELLLCGAATPSNGLSDANRAIEGRRHASVKSQGAYIIPNKKTLPKKLGAKRTGDQYVIPGNIIYKQRGTIWHPGENTIMGRDHTIHAAVAGYVKYYRDPALHPKRQYIGVTFARDDKLPYPAHGVRRRKLNMVAVPRKEAGPEPAPLSPSGIPRRVVRKEGPPPTEEELSGRVRFKKAAARIQREISIRRSNRVLLLQKDYSYRESNRAIGKLMGRHKGKTPGTVRVGSRKGMFRARRRNREKDLVALKKMLADEAARVASAASKKTGKGKQGKEAGKTKEAKKAAATLAAFEAGKSGGGGGVNASL